MAEQMKHYYYTPQQHVWDSWSDSQLRQWLIDHDIVKSDAQIRQDKLKKLVAYVYSTFSAIRRLTCVQG